MKFQNPEAQRQDYDRKNCPIKSLLGGSKTKKFLVFALHPERSLFVSQSDCFLGFGVASRRLFGW
jgi:hypothetical protein